ncbi:HEAT repeat domain-containing protein [Streptomyces sp. NPDC059479]|uniref:HEAT repeat domain-containing protein n=1 Tax=Streptomyces sp. NPDC059479 TaxID=3346848 RepID=UPI0036B03577
MPRGMPFWSAMRLSPGTRDALTSIGKTPGEIGQDINAVHLKLERKLEREADTFDLGPGSVGVFNSRIVGFGRVDDWCPPMAERSEADLVESLVNGFLAERDARSIVELHPGLRDVIVSWIREAAHVRSWTRVDKFANLAAPLRVPGLGGVLQEILDSDAVGFNKEDLVEILGEIHALDAVPCLFRVVERSVGEDAPAYWLCQKVISSLGEIGTPEALGRIRQMTAAPWPDVVRWHAAVELRIEEELGFDEDRMLG